MEKQLLIIATLDTKGREAAYVKNCVQKLGVHPILMDVGILGEPLTHPDITRVEVVMAAGYNWECVIKEKNRSLALKAVQEGGAILARDWFEKGKFHGVFGMGGGTGTAVVTHIMRSLPFGFPKMVLSTVASRDIREYIGTKDIVMFHSVADLLGSNEFMRLILGQASHAICGMIERGSVIKKENFMGFLGWVEEQAQPLLLILCVPCLLVFLRWYFPPWPPGISGNISGQKTLSCFIQ